MSVSVEKFGEKKFAEVNGKRMAYIDEGAGGAIVFQHGNPTSSYLWRNVMPHCAGLGRLVACDLIGMGGSEKLSNSGPDRYGYQEQRAFLFGLWDKLDLGNEVILVVHDWGSALGFDWARQNSKRVKGIVYMEAIVKPLTWQEWPESARKVFQGFRSERGEEMVLEKNIFLERVLPSSVLRGLTEDEMAVYRLPFAISGEDRRSMLSWPRQLPIEGEPASVVAIVEDYGRWLAESLIPKLFINAEPGSILTGAARDLCRTWPNQREISVKGAHFIQEDSPHEIGRAVAEFARSVRDGTFAGGRNR
jgi:haloalkane dehalogenase